MRALRSVRAYRVWAAPLVAALLAGCSDLEGITILPHDPNSPSSPYCSIPEFEIFSGGPGRDAIPALSDPRLVQAHQVEAEYLHDDDLVIGVRAGADVIAVPLRILWYHEIVNIGLTHPALAITHCPLTGSSLAFDRGPLEDVEFGVSGLLFRNNLIMYDRDTESLWPQMSRGARCGPALGTPLEMHPVLELTWGAWLEMNPHTWVLASETGFDRNYAVYPYGDYRDLDNQNVPFPSDLDWRRPLKERVLGVIDASGGVGYPFGELDRLGPMGVVPHPGDTGAQGRAVVFWDANARTAMAYSRTVDGVELTFAVEDERIVDEETGSSWRIDGLATAGPLAGTRLEAIAEAYVAYWFAWSLFEPDAALWEAP